MRIGIGFVAISVAFATAAPAAAQVTVRDHRRKPAPPALRVTDWSPKNGPIGTTVVINGEGFSRQTELWFGGSQVRPRRLSQKQITFLVPDNYGDGKIVLRDPAGYKGDYAVGSYTVVMPPAIRDWEPRGGAYGSQVKLVGAFFQNGDQVLMNGKPIKIVSLSPDQIVCEIPDWATTDFIVVSRAGGYESRTRGKFRVALPAPTITRISPDYGRPGTTVRLEGTNFSERARVFYGRFPVRIVQTGNNWVEVTVPDRALGSNHFTLRARGGMARSPEFKLELPPTIARFAPGYGSPGDRIEVYGEYFRDGDRLQIGGQWVKVVDIRPGQITIEVPQGGKSGPLVLWRGNDQYPARDPFEVAYAPAISDWGPHTGDYGTRVTLRGSHFGDCDVFYGGQKLRISSREGDHTIVVEVPRGARDEHFVVRSRYGEAKTGTPFAIYLAPQLDGFRPRRGRPGSELFLRGNNFTDRTKVLVGQWPAKVIAVKTGRGLLVEVPPAATEGEYEVWVQDGEYKDSGQGRFLVEGWAALDGVDPWRATYGETIVLKGRGLRPGVKVYFGETELQVKRWDRGGVQCWIDVPQGLKGSEWIHIDDSGHRARSSQKFEIYAPEGGVRVRDHRRRKRY